MTPHQREHFDSIVQRVLAELPERARLLLDEVPLIVEDYPAPRILRRLRLRGRKSLCGLYTGVPLTQRSVDLSGVPSDVIHLFREGVMAEAENEFGRATDSRLAEEIRITVLHELGHHHGLDEEDLRQLGY